MSISASPGRLSCGSSLLAGGPLCIILGALCFSTTGTVQALAPDGNHPLGIGALRMQIGALALWAWCACRHSLPAGLRHWQLRWACWASRSFSSGASSRRASPWTR